MRSTYLHAAIRLLVFFLYLILEKLTSKNFTSIILKSITLTSIILTSTTLII